MNRLEATTRCECQAILVAVLDEKRHVLRGSARREGVAETAPAHTIHADQPRFDVGWLCPFCGRNTLRTFDGDGLRAVPDAG